MNIAALRGALFLALTAASVTSVALQAQTAEQLARRAAIAARITGAVVASTDMPGAGAIEAALDLPAGTSTATTTSGDPSQIAVLGNLGIITPRAGADFVLLSSGVAGDQRAGAGHGVRQLRRIPRQ